MHTVTWKDCREPCALSDGKNRCERQCEITVGALVGETLRVELDKVCHWCGWTNSFQASYVGETACCGEAICYRISLRIQTKMEPRWEADGVFLGKLDLSDEVIVGTPKESKRHDHSDE